MKAELTWADVIEFLAGGYYVPITLHDRDLKPRHVRIAISVRGVTTRPT